MMPKGGMRSAFPPYRFCMAGSARPYIQYFSTKIKGCGPGLTIYQKIMEAHQGKITLESEPGQGNRVPLFLNKETPSGGTHRSRYKIIYGAPTVFHDPEQVLDKG